jgi:NAD-dependent dihydropyrimidine dehydrogenase PreA subunit
VKTIAFAWMTVLQTLLRVLPFPCRTGLQRIGNPGRQAPVLLTGNFRLTVERVKRALHGVDCYLLVANSRGVNVWCAATGGLLTNHDVISVLKTSGIEHLVDHRRLILPQLAATGIEGAVVHKKTGWNVVWGPVAARAIPAFLAGGLEKTVAMRTVTFPWPQRLEMAVAWAFPISFVAVLLVLAFWRQAIPVLVALVWGLSLLIFLSFPLYERFLQTRGRRIGFVFFDFGRWGLPLLLGLTLLLGIAGVTLVQGNFSWTFLLRWGVASLVVVAVLSIDLAGSTPVYKSGLHEDRLLRIVLDIQRCRAAARCEQVCPTNVFAIDRDRGKAVLVRPQRCVQCGACIVQCPFDALSFESPKGDVVTPETVRRFKLNLLGHRFAKPPRANAPEEENTKRDPDNKPGRQKTLDRSTA